MIKILERPAATCFSQNEIRYLLGNPTKIYWRSRQAADPYLDCNLKIWVNDVLAVEEYNTSGLVVDGVLDVKPGDVVRAELPVFDPWEGEGFTHLLIQQNATVLYEAENSSPQPYLTYVFTIEQASTYLVLANTRHSTELNPAPNLPPVENIRFVQVKLIYQYLQGRPQQREIFTLAPNSNNAVYLYINQYIDSLLKYVVPDMDKYATDARDQTVQFYIHWRVITETDTDPVWITTEEQKKRLAFKGAVDPEVYSRNNYFLYQAQTKLPLTWQPDRRLVMENEPLFFTCYLPDGRTDNKVLRTTAVTSDGITITNDHSIWFLWNGGYLAHINVSPAILGFTQASTGKKLLYFTAMIVNSDSGEAVTTPLTFYFDFRPRYKFFDLLFHNSLGGFDTVRVKGDITEGIAKDYTEADGGMSFNASAGRTKSSDLMHTGISVYKTFKGDAGWREDENAQDALTDLLLSKSIYQYRDGRYIPVVSIQKNVDIRITTDKKFSFQIEWQTAVTGNAYTPGALQLGIAPDTEQY